MFLGTSSARFKTDIQDANIPVDAILGLRPISYVDKSWLEEHGGDPKDALHHWGLLAEDIADGPLDMLVYRDEDGKPFSVAYDRLGVIVLPLLKLLSDRVTALEAA